MASSAASSGASRPGAPAKKAASAPERRRLTTPLVLQSHVTECGAACLGSVLAYFGRWVPLGELRGKCEVSRDGSTAAGIRRAARHYGLECSGRMLGPNQLRRLPLPLILFWEFNHFVVLEGFDRRRFFLNDPAVGRRTLTVEEFEKGWTGVALQFAPRSDFEPGGARPTFLQQLPFWLGDARSVLVRVVACGVMLALLFLLFPAMLALFVDRVLGEGEPWGLLAAGVLAATAVLIYGLTWLRQLSLKRLAVRTAVMAANRCVSRLLRLPVEFFNHRMAGELTGRVQSVDQIAVSLSERFLALAIESVMGVVFLAVMLICDAWLALIVLALAGLNWVLMRAIARIRLDRSHALRREQRDLLGLGMLMLQHMESLRMTAADSQFFSRWSGRQASALNARHRDAELGHVNAAIPGLLMAFGSVAILAFGAPRVMDGELTLGTLVGFYFLAIMFLTPIGRLVEFADRRQAIEADMSHLEDITKSAEDPVLALRRPEVDSIPTFNGLLQLAGQVELRNITFGYNRSRAPLIENFNLTIRPGQRVAVVGPSGSGKSTLARLVSGVHQPWSGDILFDGHPRHRIPEEVLRRSLSMVDQEVVLFIDTVRNNLTLWNPAVPDEAIVGATRDACIHDEILGRPLGYATPVDEGGSNFSGGQRQRLEIARALIGNPTVLVLDEATSALDVSTEQRVDDALRRRGVACLIVAHRLSTIRDCDEIIVLDKGVEVQRGTHETLMADEGGTYFKLVSTG